MIRPPEAKVTKSPAGQAIGITWSYALDGKPSELNNCWIRLGTGKNPRAVMWTRRVAASGNYKDGCVDESLRKYDLPTPKEGENLYCQILFEPKYVKKDNKITEVDERMIGLSKIIALVSHERRVKKVV